jgi:hypothetical protein
MDLTKLVEQIKEKTAETNIDVSKMDPKVWATADGLIRQAKIDLDVIKKQYTTELMNGLALIAVTGKKSSKFAKITEKAKFFTIDFLAISKVLAQNVKNRCQRDEFDSQEYLILLDEINKIKKELNVVRFPMPANTRFPDVYGKPVSEAVISLIEKTYGTELYAVFTRKQIIDEALSILYDGSHLPVIVYNYVNDEKQWVLPRPVTVVDASGEVNAAMVQKVVDEVREKINNENKGE